MGISVSLGDSVSFVDGVVLGLLTAVFAALVWANAPKFRDPGTIFTGVLALATSALVYVSWLQQRTLDKQAQTMEITDKTMRAGERAFVFPAQNNIAFLPATKTIDGKIIRQYPVVWENSGNSPTVNLVVKTYCPNPQPLSEANPITLLPNPTVAVQRLLGPKQTTRGAACIYNAEQLDMVRDSGYHIYIVSTADYFDIFDKHHYTETCFELLNFS